MKDKKIMIISIVFLLLFIGISYYLFLPALNLTSPGFWAYLFTLIIVGMFVALINFMDIRTGRFKTRTMIKFTRIIVTIICVLFSIIIIINIICSPLFNSSSYATRITINESGNFSTEVNEVDFNAIPLLDKASSSKLGDRVMGEMTDLVSQFYVSNLYTQINYNNEVVRVTPLEYSGIIKYFTNRDEGVKGYIVVSSTTGESELVKLDKGMKYMPSALFNENLNRKLRFTYPTEMF